MPIEDPRQSQLGGLPPGLMAALAALIPFLRQNMPELFEFSPDSSGQGEIPGLRPQNVQPQQPQVPQRPEDTDVIKNILLKGVDVGPGKSPGAASPGPGASQKKPRAGTPGSKPRSEQDNLSGQLPRPEILLQTLEARRRELASFQDTPLLSNPVR